MTFGRTEDGDSNPPQRLTDGIVFFGDSITRDWPLDAVAGGRPVRNRGIAGETTGQMRQRFSRDVLDARPGLVHLLGGINDIAENQGFVATAAIVDNVAAMLAAAQAAGIPVVLGLLLPCTLVRKRPHLVPQPRILALNAALADLARDRGLVVADYFAPLADAAGVLRAACTDDGLHPNAAGYAAMAPVARAAIAQATRSGGLG